MQRAGPYSWRAAHSPRGSIPLPRGRSTKALLEWGYPTLLSLTHMAAVQMAKDELGATPSKQDPVPLR